MSLRKLRVSLSGALLILGGCTIPPKYAPESEQLVNGEENAVPEKGFAVVEVTTNTLERASFQRNVKGELCSKESWELMARVEKKRIMPDYEKGARGVAAVMSLGLSTVLDPRNNVLPFIAITKQKANEELILRASSYINGGNHTTSCGPVYLKFTPEEMRHYQIQFVREDKFCRVVLSEKTALDDKKAVQHSRWSCTEPFKHIGEPEAYNIREIGKPALER